MMTDKSRHYEYKTIATASVWLEERDYTLEELKKIVKAFEQRNAHVKKAIEKCMAIIPFL